MPTTININSLANSQAIGQADAGLARDAAGIYKITDGSTGLGTLKVLGAVINERSSTPSNPSEGEALLWQSDGTGAGDDGDFMITATAGGITKTATVLDFSTGTVGSSGGGDLLAANNLSDLANATTARTNLGLGGLATASAINNADWSGTDLSIANGGTGSSTESAARTALGLAIGSDVQAYHANLASLAGLTFSNGDIAYYNSGGFQRLAAGTNGHVLTLASGLPTWAASSGGSGISELTYSTNVLTLRNGTSGQTFNIYNTFTDSSNYERGGLRWSSNVLEVFAEAAGTGSVRDLHLHFGGEIYAPVQFRSPASNIGQMYLYRPNANAWGGFLTWTNSTFEIYGGSSPTTSSAKLGLFGTWIILDPYPGTGNDTEQFVYLGSQSLNTGITKTLSADFNQNRSRGGHNLKLEGGNAYDSGATNRDGGNLILEGGDPANSGARGQIIILNLPTSAPTVSGALWNDAGTLKIA